MIYAGNYCFLSKKPVPLPPYTNILRPLSFGTWMALIGTLCIIVTLCKIIYNESPFMVLAVIICQG